MLIKVYLVKIALYDLNFALNDNDDPVDFFSFSADNVASFLNFLLAFAAERNQSCDLLGFPVCYVRDLSQESYVLLHAHAVVLFKQLIVGLVANHSEMTVRQRYDCATTRFILLERKISETVATGKDKQGSHLVELFKLDFHNLDIVVHFVDLTYEVHLLNAKFHSLVFPGFDL